MRTLAEALEHTSTAVLREIADFWEIPDAQEAGRPGLLAGLLAQMGQEETVRRAVQRLDRAERDALRTVLAAGGRLPTPVLTRAYGPLRPRHLAPANPADRNPIERLHRKGFLFRAFAAWEDWSGLAFFIPPELLPHLPRVPRAAPADLLQPRAPQEVAATPAAPALHRDVACLLAFFRRERHVLPEDGRELAGLLKALADSLASTEQAYVSFSLHLARQAHLLAPDLEGALRPTAEGQQWLRATPALRAQVLFEAWRDHPTWDDLAAIPELLVERPWPADLTLPRGRVLRHLANCPPSTWLTLSSWVQSLEANDPDFLRPGGGAGRPRVRQRETKATLEGPTSWQEVEGRTLRFLVEGPLRWLGLVDLGQGPGPEAVFRISPLGDFLLHPEAGPPDRADETVIVEGTFEVWVPAEASPYIVFVLEEYAERVQQDHVSQYRLTRESLHRALQRGERVERLLEALTRYGRGELPQNVAYTLQEWAAAYGRLRLRRPVVLAAAEAVLLEEVLADPQVQAACGERLSPTAVEVAGEHATALVERLCDLGHLPQVEEGILPQEHLTLSLNSGQGAALLALLWTWGETHDEGEPARALAHLAEALAGALPPAGLARARRQKERWQKEPR